MDKPNLLCVYNCHQLLPDGTTISIGEEISESLRGIDAGSRYGPILNCISTAIEQRDGTTLKQIAGICGMLTPLETGERFASLADNNLIKDTALADLFCRAPEYKSLDAYLTKLESAQSDLRMALSIDSKYQDRTIDRLNASEIQLPEQQQKRFETLLRGGRLNPSDIDDAIDNPRLGQGKLKNMIDTSFKIREAQLDHGFGHSR